MPFGFKFPNPFSRKQQPEDTPTLEPLPEDEKPAIQTIEIQPFNYPDTLEELENGAEETDRLRIDMCKAARDTGATLWVDNELNGAIACLVEPDENEPQFQAIMEVFNRYGYPKGEFKRSDDGGSLSTEVNWEDHKTRANGYKFIVRVFLKPEHRAPSSQKFQLFNLEKKYITGVRS